MMGLAEEEGFHTHMDFAFFIVEGRRLQMLCLR